MQAVDYDAAARQNGRSKGEPTYAEAAGLISVAPGLNWIRPDCEPGAFHCDSNDDIEAQALLRCGRSLEWIELCMVG